MESKLDSPFLYIAQQISLKRIFAARADNFASPNLLCEFGI